MSGWVWLLVPLLGVLVIGFLVGFIVLVIYLARRQSARADQMADAMTAATAPAPSLAERLDEVEALYASGRITAQERATARGAILAASPEPPL